MKNGAIQLVDLEFEYKIWKKRLDLFSSEVDLIMNRNTNLPADEKYKSLNAVELLAIEEHKEALIKLKSRIEIREQELKFYNKDFPITETHDYFMEHLELRRKNEKLLLLHLDRVSDIVVAIGV